MLFLATLLLRGAQLGRPSSFVFDEIFYANDALDLITHGIERTKVVHPPLGKWLIGLPLVFGRFTPVTWRLGALIAGAAVVVLVCVMAARLTGSLVAGVAASTLVLTDGIAHFVGRYGLLDGFVSVFTTAALAFLVFTRGRVMTSWIAAGAGLLAGAGLATKWSAFPILVLVTVVCVARAAQDGGVRRACSIGAIVAASATAMYLATFAPWVVGGGDSGNCVVSACKAGPVERLARLPAMQVSMLKAASDVERTNLLRRPASTWVLQREPMQVSIGTCESSVDRLCANGTTRTETDPVWGNRVLWPLSVGVAVLWLVRRLRRADATRGVGLAIASAALLWLPWLITPDAYLYYAGPLVPVLAVVLVAASRDVVPKGAWLAFVSVATALAAGVFVASQGAPPWSL